MDRGDTGVTHFTFPGPGHDAVCSSAQSVLQVAQLQALVGWK